MKETKFKQTEVGMIPSDWEVKTLGELFDFSAGGDLQKESFSEYPSGTIKWPIYSNSLENKGLYGYTSNPRYRANCVTITGRGSLGHAEYRREAFDAIVRLLVLSPKQHVDCYFVSETINFRVPFVFENTGVPQLTAPQAAKSKIPLPPTIEEQQRITNALSDIDTLIANLEKLIAKKKNIKQGAMQQLLTGKKRLHGFAPAKPTYKQTELGMIPTDWESINLGSIADIRTGKRNGDESETFGKYPFFVRSQTVYRINSYSFDGEAILIPGEGGIGSIFHYINGKFDYHQRVYKISDFSVNFSAKYLFYFMKRYFGPYAMTLTVKATVDSLRLPTFENFVVWYPPSKSEQTAIANVLRDMDTEIDTLEQKLAKVRKIKQGMMQKLLTGKIRLV